MTQSTKLRNSLVINGNEALKIKRAVRATEYYGMQAIFDNLYSDSKKGKKFKDLVSLISSRENILLAYRNLKTNTGGKTPGTDGLTIEYLKRLDTEELVIRIQDKLRNYQPKSVRRVYIPKANGKQRPLGIPCIEDRLVQQCIKQVLEPICEAKFNNHSYGFRPNRKAEHAIADFMKNANTGKNHFIVDVDIKGFFDNVNHAKLIKQMWALGIQDKNLIAIIRKCLKAPISEKGKEGEEILIYPECGTPQGGILSPLLSNIVLNELDWWVSNQWRTKVTKHKYNTGTNSSKYRALRKTGLKEGYLIRYADDFKICCKTKEDAIRWYHAVTQWLQDRLGLEYAPDKSKITNLKRSSSEFLGFRFKLKRKGNKWVLNSWMTNKAKENMLQDIRKQIKRLQKNTTIKNVGILNAKILGRQEYYKIATHINLDMTEIHYKINKLLRNRFDNKVKRDKKGIYNFHQSDTYKRLYGKYNYRPTIVCNLPIFPIGGITHKKPMCISNEITPYTYEGRTQMHKNLACVSHLDLEYIIKHPIQNKSAEYNDNRVSLFPAQWGVCGITGLPLDVRSMECHHIRPISMGGSDQFHNLVLIQDYVHKLIHATNEATIIKYMKTLEDNYPIKEDLYRIKDRLNKYRKIVGNDVIII